MAFKIDVHTPDGKKSGSIDLPAELFDVEPNIALMHQVVTAQQGGDVRAHAAEDEVFCVDDVPGALDVGGLR